jgi:hypothetical protein
MCLANKSSIEVSYTKLMEFQPVLANWIMEEPSIIFPYLNTVAMDKAL